MPKTYLTVSISGDVGKLMHEYLDKHKDRYPTVLTFLDEAVLEKLDKEVSKETLIPEVEDDNTRNSWTD